jgi:ATP-dependent DNA helicase PIF1
MANKICFETLGEAYGIYQRNKNENSIEKPFGGMTLVLGGDFRQIIPVLPKGRVHPSKGPTFGTTFKFWN